MIAESASFDEVISPRKVKVCSDQASECSSSPESEFKTMGSMFNYEEILFTAFNELDLPSNKVMLWASENRIGKKAEFRQKFVIQSNFLIVYIF